MLALNHVWANSSQFNHVWSRSYFWWFLISLEKAATIFGPVPWVPYVALDIQGKSVPGTAGWKRSHPSTNTSKKEKNVSKNVRKKRFPLQKHRFGAVRILFLHFNLITFYHLKKSPSDVLKRWKRCAGAKSGESVARSPEDQVRARIDMHTHLHA